MADILERFDFDDKPGLDKLKNISTAAEDVGKAAKGMSEEVEKAVDKTVQKSVDIDSIFNKIGKTVGNVVKLSAAVAGAVTVAFGAATAAGLKLASHNDRLAEQQEGLTKKWQTLREELAERVAPAVFALQKVFGDFIDKGIKGAEGLSSGFGVKLGATIIATGKVIQTFFNEFDKRLNITGIQFDIVKSKIRNAFSLTKNDPVLKAQQAALKQLQGGVSDLGDVYNKTFDTAKKDLQKLVDDGYFKLKRATKEEIAAVQKLRDEYAKLAAQIADRLEKARIENAEGLEQIDLKEKATLREIALLEEKARATAKAAGIEFDLDEEFRELRTQAELKFEKERLDFALDFNKKRLAALRKDFKDRFGIELDGVQELGKKAQESLNKEIIRQAEIAANTINHRLEEMAHNINPDGFLVFKTQLLKSLNLDDEEAGFILDGIGKALQGVEELFTANIDRRIEDNERLLESIRSRTNEIESELQRELDLQETGRENFVKSKQQELAQLAKEEAEAEKEREKLEKKKRRAQVLADTIEQTSSLVTAAANTFKGFANIPIIGLALGIAAVAALFAAFNAAKSKASSAAKTTRLYKGGSLKGKTKKDSGYVNWLYPKSDVPGRGEGHRIEGSDIVVGGREMVVAEVPANHQSDKFWQDMNSGKYNDVDLATTLEDHNTNQKTINTNFEKRKAKIVAIQKTQSKNEKVLTKADHEEIMKSVATKIIKYFESRPQFIVENENTTKVTKWTKLKEEALKTGS